MTKSYSMSVFSQVAVAMPYLLTTLAADKALISFWTQMSDFVSSVFAPVMIQTEIPRLQALYRNIIKEVFFLCHPISFSFFSPFIKAERLNTSFLGQEDLPRPGEGRRPEQHSQRSRASDV